MGFLSDDNGESYNRCHCGCAVVGDGHALTVGTTHSLVQL